MAQESERGLAGADAIDMVALAVQREFDELADIIVVVYNQEPGDKRCIVAGKIGRANIKRANPSA